MKKTLLMIIEDMADAELPEGALSPFTHPLRDTLKKRPPSR
jgi:hypothetical protein